VNSRGEDYPLVARRKVLAQVTAMVYPVTMPAARHPTMNSLEIISG
jgi:hypothetical protein